MVGNAGEYPSIGCGHPRSCGATTPLAASGTEPTVDHAYPPDPKLAQEAGASGARVGVYPSDPIVTTSAYSSLVVPAVPLV
jgi:hypothetical protein